MAPSEKLSSLRAGVRPATCSRAPVSGRQGAMARVAVGPVAGQAIDGHSEFEVDQLELTVRLNNEVIGGEIPHNYSTLVHVSQNGGHFSC